MLKSSLKFAPVVIALIVTLAACGAFPESEGQAESATSLVATTPTCVQWGTGVVRINGATVLAPHEGSSADVVILNAGVLGASSTSNPSQVAIVKAGGTWAAVGQAAPGSPAKTGDIIYVASGGTADLTNAGATQQVFVAAGGKVICPTQSLFYDTRAVIRFEAGATLVGCASLPSRYSLVQVPTTSRVVACPATGYATFPKATITASLTADSLVQGANLSTGTFGGSRWDLLSDAVVVYSANTYNLAPVYAHTSYSPLDVRLSLTDPFGKRRMTSVTLPGDPPWGGGPPCVWCEFP